jgi:ABC-type glutathione transport system ATPase component
MASRIGVLCLGRPVEVAEGKALFRAPQHPYRRMLLDAVPDLAMTGRKRRPVTGDPQPHRPAARLRLPSALPAGARPLPARAAAAGADACGAGGVPCAGTGARRPIPTALAFDRCGVCSSGDRTDGGAVFGEPFQTSQHRATMSSQVSKMEMARRLARRQARLVRTGSSFRA